LSQLSDAEFAEQILAQRLGAAHVSVGAHFRFGHKRMGDADSLTTLGKRLGFTVEALPEVVSGDEKISSTTIRQAIARGDFSAAMRLLGRPWAIEGEVRRGFQRGRAMGFATANVTLGDYQRPPFGVYAVRADLGDGNLQAGVASIGVNPTFGDVA